MNEELKQEKNASKNVHHSFDIGLAEKYGVELAILIQHFQFWIHHNRALGINEYEGRIWTYDTIESITAYYPYWSRDQVKRFLSKLVDKKILMKGNFNQTKFDRTVWYAFVDEQRFGIRQIDMAKSPNGDGGIATPIPDTKPYTRKVSTNVDTKRMGGKPPANAPPMYFTFGKKIKMKQQAYDELVKDFGVEVIKKTLEAMDDYLAIHGKKYQDYARAIRAWIKKSSGEQNRTSKEDNKAYAEKIAVNYNLAIGPRKQVKLEVGSDRLEIYSTCPTAHISPTYVHFKENGFKDQVDCALRKWKLL